jgi:hypothetical protein
MVTCAEEVDIVTIEREATRISETSLRMSTV